MSRIPRDRYVEGKYVTFSMIKEYHSKDEVKRFGKFISGQTCCQLPSGEIGIYSWDYERWISQGMQNKQMAHDWD